MRKWIIAALALAMLAPGALAVSRGEAIAIAREAANGAEATRVELDDGVYEIELQGGGARYAAEVLDATGALLELETEYPGAGGAADFALTEDEARAAASRAVAEAAGGIATRERGAQGAVYEVFYSAIGAVGEISVNAETGAIVETKLYPAAAAGNVLSDARIAERLSERFPGARIAEIELEWDDGRYVFEGEVEVGGRRSSFEMDARTGAFL